MDSTPQTVPANPLSKYFRKPSIYLRLPSRGEFWPVGSLDLPQNGEIPVYPMTAADEIVLKTPDALMNGQGVVEVIKSCCPNIINPWQMPSIDVDVVLISIRIATYGDIMEVETVCPSCKEEAVYDVPLSNVLASAVTPDYTEPVLFDGLTIKLKPQPYFSVNQTNMVGYEEQRILQTINDDALDDNTRKSMFEEHLKRLVDLNIQLVADSTEKITAPEGVEVTDPALITDFYKHTGRQLLKDIQDRLKQYSAEASIKPYSVQCNHCQHKYEVPIIFDYANFFA